MIVSEAKLRCQIYASERGCDNRRSGLQTGGQFPLVSSTFRRSSSPHPNPRLNKPHTLPVRSSAFRRSPFSSPRPPAKQTAPPHPFVVPPSGGPHSASRPFAKRTHVN